MTGGAEVAGLELVAELGRGANSVVHLVRREGVDYALKLLNPFTADDQESLAAFQREAALMAGVHHPGLPRIHEVGEYRGRSYLVMDLVVGRPLAELLAEGPLPAERAIPIVLDIAGALAAVHRTGLVHRDVKPQNIMVTDAGGACLIDFGLATRGGDTDEAAVGTLAYAPAEQSGMLNRPVDNRSDLYALGVVLFECLAGRPPFRSDDAGALLRSHATEPPPDLRLLVPGVTTTQAAVVATLLAKDPDDRYRTGEDLMTDLRRLAQDPAATFVPDPRDTPSAPPGQTPLSGRRDELARLTARWAGALAGAGGGCLIRGAGGSGKSRLARELAGRVTARGGLVLAGKSSADDAMPLVPLREAIEEQLRLVARLPAPAREEAHHRLRLAAGTSAALLATLSPALGDLLGASQLSDGERQDQFATAVADFLGRLARLSGGLLLHLDDVHWLDPGTRRVLDHLSADLSALPLLVLATARDDERSTDGTREFTAVMGAAVDVDLTLGPLDEAGVAALVATHLPGVEPDSTLAHLLAVRSDGNPFVVLESLRAVIDAGVLRPAWGRWVLDEPAMDALALPLDGVGLVLTRVRGLGPGARRILTAAAAVGMRFRPELVAGVCRIDPGPVLDATVEAAGRQLVEARAGGEYVFVHDRIREALLDGLDESELQALHRRIAANLDVLPARRPSDVYAIAHHYVLGGRGAAPDRVFRACLAAGLLAMDNFAAGEAVAFLGHAAATGRPLDAEFQRTYGTALLRDGRYAQAEQELLLALDPAASPLHRGRIWRLLGETRRATWNTEGALDALHAGFLELGARVPASRLRLALSTLGLVIAGLAVRFTHLGRGTAHGDGRRRQELLVELGMQAGYIHAVRRRPDLVILHAMRSMFWLHRLGRGPQYLQGVMIMAFALGLLRLRPLADRGFAAAAAGAAAGGDPELVAQVAFMHGAADYMAGRDDGEHFTRTTEEHGRWLGNSWYSDAAATLAWDAALRGRSEEVVAWSARGQRKVATSGRVELTAMVNYGAIAKTATGRHAEASAEIEQIQAAMGDRPDSASLQINLLMTRLHAQFEQGEFGPAFEEVAQSYLALAGPPALIIRQIRFFFVHYAFGRLAQCRAAKDAATRTARLAAARTAVKQLRGVANTRLFTAFAVVAAADLDVLSGDPGGALGRLRRLRPQRQDAPLLDFEAARVRARALAALGHPEAGRVARHAHGIADDEGWALRARWVRTEFGVLAGSSQRSGQPMPGSGAGIERLRLQALEAVSQAAARVLDPQILGRTALDEIIRILAADRAFLFLIVQHDDGTEGLVPNVCRDAGGNDIDELTGYSTSLVERVRTTGEALVVTGTEEGAVLGASSVVAHGLRSVMVAPLQLDGRQLGVIYLDSRVATGVFTPDDVGILTALTNYIAVALETARAAQLEVSVQAARRQRDLAEQLREAMAAMSAAADPGGVLAELLDASVRVLPCDDAWLITRSDGVVVEWRHPRGGGPPIRRELTGGPAITGMFRTAEPMVGTGPAAPGPLASRLGHAPSWAAVPLRTPDGLLGVLLLASDHADAYGAAELEVAATLIAQGLSAYRHAVLFAQIHQRAVVDELTGIANRRDFLEVAERALVRTRAAGHPAVALMIDIDNFKLINDGQGHPTGDDVIRAVAGRLSANISGGDVLGRYGGEEFTVFLPAADPATGARVGERLRAAIADSPIETRSGPVPVTISIGLAALLPADRDLAELLARADRALYTAKRDGRNRLHLA